jgi:hypothetical protein
MAQPKSGGVATPMAVTPDGRWLGGSYGGHAQATSYGPQAARLITGAGPEAWFGPLQPLQPMAPPGTGGRAYDYGFGANLNYIPRSGSGTPFDELRALADALPLLATVIENRKDRIASWAWAIQSKGGGRTNIRLVDKATQSEIDRVTDAIGVPDRRRDFHSWLRPLIDDMLVIDAATIYARKTRGGKLFSLDVIDGSLIKPLIGEDGRLPLPPDPAYQQILHGLPAADFTLDELMYLPRNARSRGVYGFSAVEQVLLTVNIALRREVYNLDYYRAGTIPDAFGTLPKEWTPEQIKAFQDYFDSMMQGNLMKRRGVKFMPDGFKAQDVRQPPLKDQYDEWLARIICFAFQIPPSAFVPDTARACYSADTETLTENGWKLFPDIADSERIATFNPETSSIEYHMPLKRLVYPMDGEMVRFSSRAVDVMVTPEHDMWLRPDNEAGNRAGYRKVKAKDIPKSQFKFVASAKWEGVEQETFILPGVARGNNRWADVPPSSILMDDWLEFLGWFLSEGSLDHQPKQHTTHLCQNEGPKACQIENLLARLPFNYSPYLTTGQNTVRWNIYGKQLCEWLREHTGGRAENKRIPRELLSLSTRQLRILFDAMMAGDGTMDSRENRASGAYHSISKGLADDFQELALKLGFSSSCSVHYPAHGNRRQAYRVSVCQRDHHTVDGRATSASGPANVTREPYEGYVYCFEVPNHLFVTRRNGKIGIHGNTAQTLQLQAENDGSVPQKNWVKNFMDQIIQVHLKAKGLEFAWVGDDAIDPLEQAQALSTLVTGGIKTVDEARDELGLAPLSDQQKQDMADQAAALNPPNVVGAVDPSTGKPAATTAKPAAKPAANGKTPAKPAVKKPAPGDNKDLDSGTGKFAKGDLRTLYINRPVTNAAELATWAYDQGFKTILPEDDLHTTVAFSHAPLDWDALPTDIGDMIVNGGVRSLGRFGDAVVLKFSSPEMSRRWAEIIDAGGSWDHPEYQPHITISYDGADLDLSAMTPYPGELRFGPEEFAEVKEDWRDKIIERIAALDDAAIAKLLGVAEQGAAPFALGKRKVPKGFKRLDPIPFERKSTTDGIKGMATLWAQRLTKQGHAAAAKASATLSGKLGKAGKPPSDGQTPPADDSDELTDAEIAAAADEVASALDLDLDGAELSDLESYLVAVASDAGDAALAQVGLGDAGGVIFEHLNQAALDWAKEHAAELVTQISDTTRDQVRDAIVDGIQENMSTSEIADVIAKLGVFDETRADLIAHTEIRNANSAGALAGYKAARDNGVDAMKGWLLGPNPCDDCQDNADASPIELDDDFPSGDAAPAAHPHCVCTLCCFVREATDAGGPEDDADDGGSEDIAAEE